MFGLGWGLQPCILNRVLGRASLPPLLVTFGLSVLLPNALFEGLSADHQGDLIACIQQSLPNTQLRSTVYDGKHIVVRRFRSLTQGWGIGMQRLQINCVCRVAPFDHIASDVTLGFHFLASHEVERFDKVWPDFY